MLITTHLLIGGAIGQASQNPPLAFILGFLSHLILDKIPHFDPGIWRKTDDRYDLGLREWIIIALDIITALVLLILLIPRSTQAPFIAGASGGIALDLVDNVPWWKDMVKNNRVLSWSTKLHNLFHFKDKRFRKYAGLMLIFQILLIGLVFWYIKR